MEGGLSLAGRRPVNNHADHVYVEIVLMALTWSCYKLRFFFTLLYNCLDIKH